MDNANATPAGFFRFPARLLACRSLRLVRAERIECHAPGTMFRHRHTEEEPVKTLLVAVKSVTPARVSTARITVRV